SGRELATFIPLVIIAFWIGLYPKPFFQILSTPVNNLVATVRPDYPGLNKHLLAVQPVKPNSEAASPLPETPKGPESQKPATSGDDQKSGVASRRSAEPSPRASLSANISQPSRPAPAAPVTTARATVAPADAK